MTETLFKQVSPAATLRLDGDFPPSCIYVGMRVVITQNRDKANNVVNGQLAIVYTVQNQTVVLRLPNDQLVPLHPVTTTTSGQQKSIYSFCPAYATTMCTAQGQTLSKVVLWFDINNIPPGTAYVAFSRVRCLNDIYFLNYLKTHFLHLSNDCLN